MKPPPFEYHLAESVDEAVALLAEHGDEAKVLAGGQSLIPLLSLRLARPAHLIDINRLAELASITDGDGLEIGAMVRQRQAERSDVVRPRRRCWPRPWGSSATPPSATGARSAAASPTPTLPPSCRRCCVALDGEVVARSARGSAPSPPTLFEGFLTTALAPDELLTAVRVPALAGRRPAGRSRSSAAAAATSPSSASRPRCGLDGRRHGRPTPAWRSRASASTPVRAAAAEALLAARRRRPSCGRRRRPGRRPGSIPPATSTGRPPTGATSPGCSASRALARGPRPSEGTHDEHEIVRLTVNGRSAEAMRRDAQDAGRLPARGSAAHRHPRRLRARRVRGVHRAASTARRCGRA